MPKRLGSSEVIRVLQSHGFFFATQKGSHAKRLKEIVLVRGNPRAVIGSMNDMVGLLERTAGRPDWAPAKDDEDFINITPFSAINWDHPRHRFQTELQKLLDHRPRAC